MKSELQKKLIEKYPHFFHTGGLKIYTGEKPVKNEVDELLNQKEMVLPIQFGFECGDDFVRGMVYLAESLSYHICENCGSTKNVFQTKDWITTLCEDCMIKNNE